MQILKLDPRALKDNPDDARRSAQSPVLSMRGTASKTSRNAIASGWKNIVAGLHPINCGRLASLCFRTKWPRSESPCAISKSSSQST